MVRQNMAPRRNRNGQVIPPPPLSQQAPGRARLRTRAPFSFPPPSAQAAEGSGLLSELQLSLAHGVRLPALPTSPKVVAASRHSSPHPHSQHPLAPKRPTHTRTWGKTLPLSQQANLTSHFSLLTSPPNPPSYPPLVPKGQRIPAWGETPGTPHPTSRVL
jgi:hypothetical protein